MNRSSSKGASARVRRQPTGSRERIRVRVPQDDGYVYRIANNAADGGDRVENLLDLGYEIYHEAKRENDRRVDDASAVGTASSNFNLGRTDRGTMMRIKKEYWEEDQIAKHARGQALEQTMKDDVRQAADYGGFSVQVEK